ncbi:MAG: orotate phosphoribosyltransferase [Armatimonadetes bacterium CG2_30_59_28]|nr:MAG: orotate phosphoribosyltransferase [Armatimonadetes bacterium CG2_30_59_28]
MLTTDEITAMFTDCGALLQGHFLLTSGLHSGQYLEKFRVLQHPKLTSGLCREFAERFQDAGIQVVVGPATGGIILAFETGRLMGIRSIFTERENGKMSLRRGFHVAPGTRVLVVEDIVTTGGSVRECIEAVCSTGGDVVGVGLLVDRSNGKLDLGVRTESLLRANIPTFLESECPMCAHRVELVKPGSRELPV